jgi:hypothetical protein
MQSGEKKGTNHSKIILEAKWILSEIIEIRIGIQV